jgi:alpha-beta hydrolase superfamily lysophospholipase
VELGIDLGTANTVVSDVPRGILFDEPSVMLLRRGSGRRERAVDGVTLRVRVWPAVDTAHRPVVLLPATGETVEDWDIIAASLQSSRTIYAVSLRGHGRSDRPGTTRSRR